MTFSHKRRLERQYLPRKDGNDNKCFCELEHGFFYSAECQEQPDGFTARPSPIKFPLNHIGNLAVCYDA